MKKLNEILVGLVFVAVGYWVWPDGVSNMPLSSLTMALIGKSVLSISIVLIGAKSILESLDRR